MNVVSIVVFIYLCMGVIGYRVLGESPFFLSFFLSINVSMAGVLYTMVSCMPYGINKASWRRGSIVC